MYILAIMPGAMSAAAVLAAEAVLLQQMYRHSGGVMKGYRSNKRQAQQLAKYRGRTKPRPRAGRIPRKVDGLTKQVKELKQLAESDMGTHTHRNRVTWNAVSAVNAQNFLSVGTITKTLIEEVLSTLKYYNPSDPATLVTAAGATGTFQKDFYFQKAYSKITVRNNYRVPCMVSVYSCEVKSDTDITPSTAYVNGLADIGGLTSTNPLVSFTDGKQVEDLYILRKSKKRRLEPGQQFSLNHAPPKFQYDPSLSDNHDLEYQTNFHAHAWMVMVQGVISHDSVEDEQGIIGAAVDFMVDTTFVLKYPAGANIVQMVMNDESATFTNGAVVSNKPSALNQAYSVGLGF